MRCLCGINGRVREGCERERDWQLASGGSWNKGKEKGEGLEGSFFVCVLNY